ncbi:hypothetical protein LXG23DRAFT_56645 [Yarrowia lipolytica]|nr:hypothetical protein LXG23DRAFT_56645 [Yarrowia lipolytica]
MNGSRIPYCGDSPKLLGCTENELGIRSLLESQGHTLVTTSSKDGDDSVLDMEIVDADVVITTPFHPGYITRERIDKAKKLKICITAGVGSDHVDLDAANARDIAVLEVTGSNVQSVAEHVVMTMLVLVRNFVPAHEQIISGGWDVAAVAKDSYDLEGKRCKPFDPMEMLYYDYQPMPADVEKEIGCRRVESLEKMLSPCDVVTINCPLHASTKGLSNKKLISHMKDGAWLVNTARGAICVTEDIVEALESGKIRGYYGGGNAMTPHISGTSIDAQARYAKGTKNIFEVFFSGKQGYRPQDIICINGNYGTKAYGDDKEHSKK